MTMEQKVKRILLGLMRDGVVEKIGERYAIKKDQEQNVDFLFALEPEVAVREVYAAA
jgi:hypothetical protein